LQVVLICTGNRFRSPLAEAVLRSRAPAQIEVTSLGLYDLGPVPPLNEALDAARRSNLDISAHRARPLKGQTLDQADLVLGFERIHLAAAVVDARAARERTFTLPELVQLLGEIEPPDELEPIARAKESIRRAHGLRDGLPPPASLPEITDPWGASTQVFVATGVRVVDLSRHLVTALFGSGQ
jgi:protein-tyrosine-phosphatase